MKTIKLHLLVVMLITAASSTSFGAWGLYDLNRSYIGFANSLTPGSDDYSVWNGAAGSFQGASFGTFATGDTLTLSYYNVKTYKNSGSDVTGGTFFWRVYTAGSPTGAFNSIALGWEAELGGGNQQWGLSGNTSNLLAGLSFNTGLKNYTLEVYAQMNGTNPNTSVFDNNNGNLTNYTASLSTVPEPGTIGLIGLGALAIGAGVRRRKA
jgi:hypothetical protein